MSKKIKCPKCKSTQVVALDTKKKLSAKKGLLGAAITAPFSAPVTAVGAAVGALSGKRGKTTMLCQECGRTFEVKL